ncbi:MAG TPA: alpha/beta hydrolase [Pyrinomonadaceae bacterium]|nr:alpha/beta hydrolase [Pyrinomonadaceae bacterium]
MKYFLLALFLLAPVVTAEAATPKKATISSVMLRFSDVQLKTGVRLRYAEQGNPKGEPVILLHGYGDSWVSYSRILPLIDKKYHVYVPDQRGHGESDRPASGYTFPDFATDVIAFMDAKGLKQATIVGHSMGSFVAQHMATAAPERVTKLVLVGSATSVHNNVVLEVQREVSGLSDPVSPKFVREFQYGVISRPVPDKFMDQVIQASLKLPARIWKDVMAGMLASPRKLDLSKVTAPTLIVWGDKESVFPDRSDQEALTKAIPNAVLKVYEGTGHCPNWEKPERFVKDLEAFIEKKHPQITQIQPGKRQHESVVLAF